MKGSREFVQIDRPVDLDADLVAFSLRNPSGSTPRDEYYWRCIDGAWKCVMDKETVGMLAWKLEREDDGTEWVYITDVCTDERFRRQGIAKSLIHHAIIEWKKRKLWRYYLNVVVENVGAQALYTSCGFSIRERIKGYYLDDYYEWMDDDDDLPESSKDDAFEMERQSSRVHKKEKSPGFQKKEQTIKNVRFGSTEYRLYALRYCCHPGGWGWKIDYDDYGLIECHDHDEFYQCATDAFRAVDRFFSNNKHDIEREAIRRKTIRAAGRDPLRE